MGQARDRPGIPMLRIPGHPCQVPEGHEPAVTPRGCPGTREEERLIDLYCGYGLFAHYLSARYAAVCGVDATQASIETASGGRRRKRREGEPVFFARRIAPDSLRRLAAPFAELFHQLL